jgi:DNA polymerase-3 subunit chi
VKQAIIPCLKYALKSDRGSKFLNTKIYFIVLNSPQKQKIVCDLVEKCYLAKKRVVINVKDQEEGERFDNLLWNWKQSSFVPHMYLNILNTPQLEPVMLTSKIENNSDYKVLVIIEPLSIDIIKKFPIVIDFAEKFDVTRLNQSRERYKKYRDDGFHIETMQPGEFLTATID